MNFLYVEIKFFDSIFHDCDGMVFVLAAAADIFHRLLHFLQKTKNLTQNNAAVQNVRPTDQKWPAKAFYLARRAKTYKLNLIVI